MTTPSDVRVGVVGAGLIGGSICRALRSSGVADVVVFSPSSSTVAEVGAAGFRTVGSVADVVAESDVLFVCVPLGVQQSVFGAITDAVRESGKKDLLVTDVASVKGVDAAKASALFESVGVAYVPGHPMAGTEESGFAASSEDMFEGATWVLCPERTAPHHVLVLLQLLLAMQAKVSLLDIESHDRGVAAISHLPYALAATLVNVLPGGDDRALAMRLAAGSFRDVSRVAGSEPWLSASMLNFNSVEVRKKLADAISALADLQSALERGDDEGVLGFFKQARSLRAGYLSMKSSSETDSITVPLDGAVPALMASCGAGALIRSVTVGDNQWNVVLER